MTHGPLNALPDGDLLEHLWEEALGPEDELTSQQATFYFAEHVNMEVLNGGLVQYFMNTRGDEIEDAQDALKTIGAAAHRAIFDRAVDIWNAERAIPGSCWDEELDHRAFSESRIAEPDDEWEALEDLGEIEIRFAGANPDGFAADLD